MWLEQNFELQGNVNRLCILDIHGFLLEYREPVCAEATELALCTMSERSWSLHLTDRAPPLRYASAMNAHAEIRTHVASVMTAEWISILTINSLAYRDVDTRRLNEDEFWMNFKPVRWLYVVFELGQLPHP